MSDSESADIEASGTRTVSRDELATLLKEQQDRRKAHNTKRKREIAALSAEMSDLQKTIADMQSAITQMADTMATWAAERGATQHAPPAGAATTAAELMAAALDRQTRDAEEARRADRAERFAAIKGLGSGATFEQRKAGIGAFSAIYDAIPQANVEARRQAVHDLIRLASPLTPASDCQASVDFVHNFKLIDESLQDLVALWPHLTIKAKWTRAKAVDVQPPFDGQLVSEWRIVWLS